MDGSDKKNLAIVSSYSQLCGNASYTKALAKELSQHFNVSVVELNVDLLRRGNSRQARLHIKELCSRLKTFDCVNIQLEAGLFGSNPSMVRRNFFLIAKSSKQLVITMHRYHSKDRFPSYANLVKSLCLGGFKKYLLACKRTYANNRYVPFYKRVINYCKQKKVPIIVHTKRDKELIGLDFNCHRVFDHPLSFYHQDYIQALGKERNKEAFCREFRLDASKIYIGIFGFINLYKGHKTVIKALKHLPDHYELLICGAQHPHTIQMEEPIDRYLDDLLKMIELLQLSNRVKFYRLAEDDEFLKALMGCDFNVLPYLEVKQGGSAIAALSLETNSRAIFSQNLAFFELEKYASNCFKMFSIGNDLELANAILAYDESKYTDALKAYHQKYNIRTAGLLYRDLLQRKEALFRSDRSSDLHQNQQGLNVNQGVRA